MVDMNSLMIPGEDGRVSTAASGELQAIYAVAKYDEPAKYAGSDSISPNSVDFNNESMVKALDQSRPKPQATGGLSPDQRKQLEYERNSIIDGNYTGQGLPDVRREQIGAILGLPSGDTNRT